MDLIKEAFFKIKEDIQLMRDAILELKEELDTLKKQTNSTYNHSQDTQQTDRQTNKQPPESLYGQNTSISIGNKGVPTDRQTDQQTDSHTQNAPISEFKKANEILGSLDAIKKEIRLKFKRLTTQEMLVFSTLYAFEGQNTPETTYKLIADQLKLSESSIRDYTNKLIKKGIPIEKFRQNNKTILLKISQDLKNVATLTTIQELRDL
jgi:DNA-binding MarR family transcriptional regulator